MTVATLVQRRRTTGAGGERTRRTARDERRSQPLPPLSNQLALLRSVLVVLLVLCVCGLVHLVLISSLQHGAAQDRAYDLFRADLARGTAPIGPNDAEGEPLELGRPVAYMEIRAIGLQQVVGEGTTGAVLFDGPGHRRDTVLPGQVGTSVVMGRRAAYGGPFGNLEDLEIGDVITVGTGQGVFDFSVTALRRAGDPIVAGTAARLTLITTDGSRILPSELLRVDADLIGDPVIGAPRTISTTALPASERAMGTETATIWVLALWLQAVLLLSVVSVWAWHRWGRAQAWVVCVPPLALAGLSASAETLKLLPNLL